MILRWLDNDLVMCVQIGKRFDPNEDRVAVLSQVRALNDLVKQAPDLVILPSHDAEYLTSAFDRADIDRGFLPEH